MSVLNFGFVESGLLQLVSGFARFHKDQFTINQYF